VALEQLHSTHHQHTRQQKQQPAVAPAVLRLLRAGLLPAVGRADELVSSSCVRGGSYRSALRSLMGEQALLAALPQDVARSLALTYWHQVGWVGVKCWAWRPQWVAGSCMLKLWSYRAIDAAFLIPGKVVHGLFPCLSFTAVLLCCVQEATPAALLTANDMLLKLEGADSAQALQLPQGTGLSAALAAAGGGGAAGSSAAAAAAAMACKLGGAGGAAALPQVHGVLLLHLDLVPSRGGLEAAGLRFLQLQVGVKH
jgi:hypothetical protein